MTSIENGPAQAPNPNNRKHTSQVHPERVPSTLGGDTPVHPDFSPNSRVDSLKNRNKYIVGGAAVLSVLAAAGFGGKILLEQGTKNIAENLSGTTINEEGIAQDTAIDLDKGIATLESPTPVNELTQADMEAMTSDTFKELDDAVRLNAYGPKLEEWRDGAYKILYKYMSEEEKTIVSNEFPLDKTNFSTQDILNQYTIDIFDASSQGNEPAKIDQGRKLLSVLMSPDNPRYDENSEISGGAQGGIKSVREATSDYPRLENVTFRGHNIGSNGAEIIRYTSPDGKEGISLFTLLKTPEGNSVWQYTDEYYSTDTSIDYDISQAIAKSQK